MYYILDIYIQTSSNIDTTRYIEISSCVQHSSNIQTSNSIHAASNIRYNGNIQIINSIQNDSKIYNTKIISIKNTTTFKHELYIQGGPMIEIYRCQAESWVIYRILVVYRLLM